MIETLPTPETEILRRPWTREEYHKAAELGLFGPDERLELIYGEVYQKVSPQKSGHAFVIRALDELLSETFGERFDVRAQLPLRWNDDSEPEPDISVVPGHWRDYQSQHPHLGAAVLVVEVSDTSLRLDPTLKAALYAEAEVLEYWIVNLKDRVLEVYRGPAPRGANAGPRYRVLHVYQLDEAVSPLSVPGARLAVGDFLPSE